MEDAQCTLGDLVVGPLLVRRQANLDLLGDRLHAIDAPHRCLGRELLRITRDEPGQCHDPGFGNHPDMRCLDPRLEFQLFQHVLLQLIVTDHENPSDCGVITQSLSARPRALIHVKQSENGAPRRSMRCYSTAGRLKRKMVPPSGLASMASSPPWPSIIARQIESPTPIPWAFVVTKA